VGYEIKEYEISNHYFIRVKEIQKRSKRDPKSSRGIW
jgi:hypothetical protein